MEGPLSWPCAISRRWRRWGAARVEVADLGLVADGEIDLEVDPGEVRVLDLPPGLRRAPDAQLVAAGDGEALPALGASREGEDDEHAANSSRVP